MRPLFATPRVAAILVAALTFSGCAATFGGYDLAESGLPREEDAFRRALVFEPVRAYEQVIEGERALPDDDLLRLLFAGTAGYYAGTYDESCKLLDLASYLAEDRVTFSVSRQALSLVTSDRTLAYTPGRTERLMIHYVAAMMYLHSGDVDAAAVEARRIEALLDLHDDDTDPVEIGDQSRFLHYFAGAVFEAAGDWNAADVAYRRSGDVAASLGTGLDDEGVGAVDSLGSVLVLVEHGFVPHRVEQSVVIVIPPAQATMLTEGSAGEKAAAAAEAAARILLSASARYGDRSGYYHDRGYHSTIELDPWRDACEGERRCGEADGEAAGGSEGEAAGEGDPYLLRVSWPVLFQEPSPTVPLRVRAGTLGVDAAARLDLAAATRQDFEAQRPEILARTVLRAATKMALTASARESVEKKDEAAGQLLGILTNIGTMLTERADTRAWHLLPGSISMVRLRLPAGTHELSVEVDRDRGERGRTESLGTVVVEPGHTTFASTRLWW